MRYVTIPAALSDQVHPPGVGDSGAAPSGSEADAALLDGIRVVELATIVMAPSACAILTDFGAEVIKIEAPGRGDIYRYFQDLPGMPDEILPKVVDRCFDQAAFLT